MLGDLYFTGETGIERICSLTSEGQIATVTLIFMTNNYINIFLQL